MVSLSLHNLAQPRVGWIKSATRWIDSFENIEPPALRSDARLNAALEPRAIVLPRGFDSQPLNGARRGKARCLGIVAAETTLMLLAAIASCGIALARLAASTKVRHWIGALV